MTDPLELKALRTIIDQSVARLEQLESEVAREHAELDEQRSTRRGMLRLAGAAAVGGLAAAVAATDPVAALDGGFLILGNSIQTAQSHTGITVNAAAELYGLGCFQSGNGTPNASLGRPALFGHANGTAFNVAVGGHSTGLGDVAVVGIEEGPGDTGIAVLGNSVGGTGVSGFGTLVGVAGSASSGLGMTAQGGRGAIRLDPEVGAEPPTRVGSYQVGVLDTDGSGNVWYCYQSGTPGKWRKLAGAGTAGAFHPITPTRVYDSRAAAPSPGLLASGNNRLVSVADGRDNNGTVTAANIVAAGATAVAANITITGTTGGFGYLAINPGGNTVEGASTINWSAAGLTTANGVTLTLNATRQLTVICGGAADANTQFIVDIAGYYL